MEWKTGMATQRNPEVEALEKAAEAWRKQHEGKEGQAGGNTRVQERKEQDPRLKVLEQAAEAFPREKEKEKPRKVREGKEGSKDLLSCIDVMPVTDGKVEEAKRGEGKQAAGDMNWPSLKPPQPEGEGEVKKRRLNSASMSVVLRAAVAREKGIARGIRRPDPFLVVFEKEAAMRREREEAIRTGIRREIGMIQKLVQLMNGDGLFNRQKEKKEEWGIGQVSCFVDKVPQDGWNLIVVALEQSQFISRWEWGDLLGVYRAELDDQLALKNYVRITTGEIEEYLRKNK